MHVGAGVAHADLAEWQRLPVRHRLAQCVRRHLQITKHIELEQQLGGMTRELQLVSPVDTAGQQMAERHRLALQICFASTRFITSSFERLTAIGFNLHQLTLWI